MLKKTPGMPCPSCGTYIAMSIEDLLSGCSFKCPNTDCNTELHIDRGRSAASMDALEKLKEGLSKAGAAQQAAAGFGKAPAQGARQGAAKASQAPSNKGVVMSANQGKPGVIVSSKPVVRGGR